MLVVQNYPLQKAEWLLPLRPMAADFSWAALAACKIPEDVRTAANWYADAATVQCKMAIAICNECPVKEPCLQHALDTDEEFGVWGGMTPAQRSMILRGHSRERALMVSRTYSR